MTIRRLALLFVLLQFPAASGWSQSEPLGRLFFTPQQRAVLDRQRQLNLMPNRMGQEDSGSLTINGVVKRSSGRHTTWVNGIPNTEAEAIPGVLVPPDESSRGKMKAGNDRKDPPLKVGETYRRDSGEKQDLLNGGEIAIRRADAGRR